MLRNMYSALQACDFAPFDTQSILQGLAAPSSRQSDIRHLGPTLLLQAETNQEGLQLARAEL